MKDKKHAIRQLLRAQRSHLSSTVVDRVGRAVAARLRELPQYATALSVVSYIPDENEVPTAALHDEITCAGRGLYLPRNGAGLVSWRPGEPLQCGRGGVLEPVGSPVTQLSPPAVVLTPVVAWDCRGTRLGRGGGFYDRLFAQLPPGVIRIGLAYEFQEHPGLPRDPWDALLHYVITERRAVRCGVEFARGVSLQKGGLQIT